MSFANEVPEWNDDVVGERMRRLRHRLREHEHVAGVELKPGRALDAATIELTSRFMTLPAEVATTIYDQGLAIRSYRGSHVMVSAPEVDA